MPVDKSTGAGDDFRGRLAAGVGQAGFGIAVFDEQPEPPVAGALVGETEGDHHALAG